VIAEVEKARPAALAALAEHRDWLSARLAGDGTPAGGAGFRRPAPRPGHVRPQAVADAVRRVGTPDAILARAEDDLERLTDENRRGGRRARRHAGARCSAGWAPPRRTRRRFLAFCADALAAQTAFVRDHDLVPSTNDPVEVIDHAGDQPGIAVATATRRAA